MQRTVLSLMLVLAAGSLFSQETPADARDLQKRLNKAPENIFWSAVPQEEILLGSPVSPMVRVFLGEKGPFLFLLDTGSDMVLLKEEAASQAGLHPVRTSHGQELVALDELVIGKVRMQGVVAGVSNWDGPVDGILGFNLFQETCLTIDLPRMRYRIEPPCQEATEEDNTIKFRYHGENVPSIPVRIGNKRIDLVISTGLSEQLRIPSDAVSYFGIKIPPMAAVSTSSFSVDEKVQMTRVTDNLFLGNHIVMEPILTIGETDHYTLGCGILRYFRLVFDPAHMLVTFVRQSDIPIEIPSVRQLGFTPALDNQGWYIQSVRDWLKELSVDLKAGDRILQVEDRAAETLTDKDWVELERLNNYLSLVVVKDGKPVVLEIPMRIILP